MGERGNAYGVLVGKPIESDHLEDPGKVVQTSLKPEMFLSRIR